VREDVPLDVDARGQLGELHPLRGEREDAALGDIEDALAAPGSVFAAEGPVLDLGDELAAAAFVQDHQTAVRDDDAQAGSVEGAGEYHPLRGLADVDEAASAGKLGAKLGDIDVALRVGLGEAEKGEI